MAASKKPNLKQSGVRLAEQRAQKLAEELDYELVEVALSKEPTGRFLRFTIDVDKAGGISLDDCEKFHRRAAPMMDDIDYDYMEVTSPGADRPLKTERDLDNARGVRVEVRLYKQQSGVKQFTGVLQSADANELVLDIAGSPKALLRTDIALVRLALDESELNNPAFEALETEQALENAQAFAADEAAPDKAGSKDN